MPNETATPPRAPATTQTKPPVPATTALSPVPPRDKDKIPATRISAAPRPTHEEGTARLALPEAANPQRTDPDAVLLLVNEESPTQLGEIPAALRKSGTPGALPGPSATEGPAPKVPTALPRPENKLSRTTPRTISEDSTAQFILPEASNPHQATPGAVLLLVNEESPTQLGETPAALRKSGTPGALPGPSPAEGPAPKVPTAPLRPENKASRAAPRTISEDSTSQYFLSDMSSPHLAVSKAALLLVNEESPTQLGETPAALIKSGTPGALPGPSPAEGPTPKAPTAPLRPENKLSRTTPRTISEDSTAQFTLPEAANPQRTDPDAALLLVNEESPTQLGEIPSALSREAKRSEAAKGLSAPALAAAQRASSPSEALSASKSALPSVQKPGAAPPGAQPPRSSALLTPPRGPSAAASDARPDQAARTTADPAPSLPLPRALPAASPSEEHATLAVNPPSMRASAPTAPHQEIFAEAPADSLPDGTSQAAHPSPRGPTLIEESPRPASLRPLAVLPPNGPKPAPSSPVLAPVEAAGAKRPAPEKMAEKAPPLKPSVPVPPANLNPASLTTPPRAPNPPLLPGAVLLSPSFDRLPALESPKAQEGPVLLEAEKFRALAQREKLTTPLRAHVPERRRWMPLLVGSAAGLLGALLVLWIGSGNEPSPPAPASLAAAPVPVAAMAAPVTVPQSAPSQAPESQAAPASAPTLTSATAPKKKATAKKKPVTVKKKAPAKKPAPKPAKKPAPKPAKKPFWGGR